MTPLHRFILLACTLLAAVPARADLAVATLHPALDDLAKQVGGERISLVPLLKAGSDPHAFSPKPEDVKLLRGVRLILASGKGMETYLDKLGDNLGKEQKIIEVGKTIPDLTEAEEQAILLEAEEAHDHAEDDGHEHGHHHHGAGTDPHWWNSTENIRRAASVLAEAFSREDPANAAAYRSNAAAYAERLRVLKNWAKKELAAVPQDSRKIATAHLSMTYFAKEFGFKLIAVQGLSPTAKATSGDLASAITRIKKHRIKAVFPEQGVNAKQLDEIIAESGAKKGGELVADGNGTGEFARFENAFRHNVTTIAAALR